MYVHCLIPSSLVSLSGFSLLISAQWQCDGKILDVWVAMTGSDFDTVFCLNLRIILVKSTPVLDFFAVSFYCIDF